MDKMYDYEWITQDINNSIFIKLVQVSNDGKISNYGVYIAIDVIDFAGQDMTVGQANVNDLTNLLTVGTMRFKNFSTNEIIDIPFNKLFDLYQKANVITSDVTELKVTNELQSLEDLNAFTIVGKEMATDQYKIISTILNHPSEALKKLIEYAKDYPNMSMEDKFNALSEVNRLNYFQEKNVQNR